MNPIAFHLFGFPVYWYGISYVAAFILVERFLKWYLKIYSKDIDLNHQDIENLFIYTVFGVLIGARFGEFLFFQKNIFTKEIFYIHHGGMSFHGGFLGTIIAVYFFCKKYNKSFTNTCDLICLGMPIGLFLGRLANHINKELKGTYSCILGLNHPIALYEAFTEGILLFCILNYKNNLKKSLYNTSNTFIYYGILRSCTEFMRIDTTIYGINVAQILSVIMILIGIIIKQFYKPDHYQSL